MRPPLIPPQMREWTLGDGYVLRGRVWESLTRERSRTVVYLHGIQSHGGWFEWSASLLAQQGCHVILPDRRGSGLNGAARGDTPSAERWLEDIDELAAWGQRDLGATQFDVVGASWGGKLALAWSLRHPQQVGKLLLIGPGLFPAVDLSPLGRIRVGLSLLTGGRRTFAIPLNDPALFTDNAAGQAFIADDHLKLTRATARFLWHSERLSRRLLRTDAGALRAETTLVLAGKDRIILNGPTEEWVRRVADHDVKVVALAEAAHTLELAADPTALRELITQWAAERL